METCFLLRLRAAALQEIQGQALSQERLSCSTGPWQNQTAVLQEQTYVVLHHGFRNKSLKHQGVHTVLFQAYRDRESRKINEFLVWFMIFLLYRSADETKAQFNCTLSVWVWDGSKPNLHWTKWRVDENQSWLDKVCVWDLFSHLSEWHILKLSYRLDILEAGAAACLLLQSAVGHHESAGTRALTRLTDPDWLWGPLGSGSPVQRGTQNHYTQSSDEYITNTATGKKGEEWN